MNPLTELIRPHVDELIASSNAGNKDASDTIKWYQAFCRCPEPGAQVICEEAFKAWKAKQC